MYDDQNAVAHLARAALASECPPTCKYKSMARSGECSIHFLRPGEGGDEVKELNGLMKVRVQGCRLSGATGKAGSNLLPRLAKLAEFCRVFNAVGDGGARVLPVAALVVYANGNPVAEVNRGGGAELLAQVKVAVVRIMPGAEQVARSVRVRPVIGAGASSLQAECGTGRLVWLDVAYLDAPAPPPPPPPPAHSAAPLVPPATSAPLRSTLDDVPPLDGGAGPSLARFFRACGVGEKLCGKLAALPPGAFGPLEVAWASAYQVHGFAFALIDVGQCCASLPDKDPAAAATNRTWDDSRRYGGGGNDWERVSTCAKTALASSRAFSGRPVCGLCASALVATLQWADGGSGGACSASAASAGGAGTCGGTGDGGCGESVKRVCPRGCRFGLGATCCGEHRPPKIATQSILVSPPRAQHGQFHADDNVTNATKTVEDKVKHGAQHCLQFSLVYVPKPGAAHGPPSSELAVEGVDLMAASSDDDKGTPPSSSSGSNNSSAAAEAAKGTKGKGKGRAQAKQAKAAKGPAGAKRRVAHTGRFFYVRSTPPSDELGVGDEVDVEGSAGGGWRCVDNLRLFVSTGCAVVVPSWQTHSGCAGNETELSSAELERLLLPEWVRSCSNIAVHATPATSRARRPTTGTPRPTRALSTTRTWTNGRSAAATTRASSCTRYGALTATPLRASTTRFLSLSGRAWWPRPSSLPLTWRAAPPRQPAPWSLLRSLAVTRRIATWCKAGRRSR